MKRNASRTAPRLAQLPPTITTNPPRPEHNKPNTSEALSIPTALPIGCRAYGHGLILPDGLDFDVWMNIGHDLTKVAGALMWILGDWFAYGQSHYGEGKSTHRVPTGLYAEISAKTGFAEKTLSNAKWVCMKFPHAYRLPGITHSHAQEIVGLTTEDQYQLWVDHVIKEKLTVAALREALRKAKAIYGPEENDDGTKIFLETARQFSRDYLDACDDWKPAYRAAILGILTPVLKDLGAVE